LADRWRHFERMDQLDRLDSVDQLEGLEELDQTGQLLPLELKRKEDRSDRETG
jgi:hypothetical protein